MRINNFIWIRYEEIENDRKEVILKEEEEGEEDAFVSRRTGMGRQFSHGFRFWGDGVMDGRRPLKDLPVEESFQII